MRLFKDVLPLLEKSNKLRFVTQSSFVSTISVMERIPFWRAVLWRW